MSVKLFARSTAAAAGLHRSRGALYLCGHGRSGRLGYGGNADEHVPRLVQIMPYQSDMLTLPGLKRGRFDYQKRQVVAMYDCTADSQDELSLREGDLVSVIAEGEAGWFDGGR